MYTIENCTLFHTHKIHTKWKNPTHVPNSGSIHFFLIRPEFEWFQHREKNIQTLIKFYFQSLRLPEVLTNTGFEIKAVQDRHIIFLWHRQRSNQNRPKTYQKKVKLVHQQINISRTINFKYIIRSVNSAHIQFR